MQAIYQFQGRRCEKVAFPSDILSFRGILASIEKVFAGAWPESYSSSDGTVAGALGGSSWFGSSFEEPSATALRTNA
jgi:hypothetical protein